jgi:hypothetical protein
MKRALLILFFALATIPALAQSPVIGGPVQYVFLNPVGTACSQNPPILVYAAQVYVCNTSNVYAAVSGSGGTVTSVTGTANQIDVATGTTTPVISLDANFLTSSPSVAANTVFGNFTGSPASPTFTAAPTFSAANLTNFPTLNQNTTGTATNATNVAITGAVATSASFFLPFVANNSTSNQGLNTTAALNFNPSTGLLAATTVSGLITPAGANEILLGAATTTTSAQLGALLAASLATSNAVNFGIGVGGGNKQNAQLGFGYVGSGSSSNYGFLQVNGGSQALTFTGTGAVNIPVSLSVNSVPVLTASQGTMSSGVGVLGTLAVNAVLASTVAAQAGHFTNLQVVTSLGGTCSTVPIFNVFDGTSNTGSTVTATSSTQTKGTGTSTAQTLTFAAGDVIGIYISTAGATCTLDQFIVTAQYSTP